MDNWWKNGKCIINQYGINIAYIIFLYDSPILIANNSSDELKNNATWENKYYILLNQLHPI